MHIEPGIVTGAKLALSYLTATSALTLTAGMAWETLRQDGGGYALISRSVITTVLVFSFFEVLPHHAVGVSEVHLILGSTLFLMFGAGPTAVGLALGLLMQGLFFAPFDLPQYGMNVTTLLVPLWLLSHLARRLIAPDTLYVRVTYRQALALSTAYQGGIVVWVAFWALYGQGVNAENLASVASFGIAYMSVVILEPLIDLGVLALAKTFAGVTRGSLFNRRLHQVDHHPVDSSHIMPS
ncbi:cobalt transporter [Terasakiispira papahanaumokuakeensis]|uniref:Cobalt transporter n=1 Tax=Terasakiispira papahanaumokuakeensis TaxID=197479 RepID=A0A1E2V9D6_9GAMM|nr:energy-coupling factor ABC transporter permease [Terasakiispira papahanaumokuakeensis]ODC03472.1 cobalt transporter [Terasakiispira papahanaumokuakeensis]